MSDFQDTMGDRGGRGPRRPSKFSKFGARGRAPVIPEEPLDYKNLGYLARFLTAQGKIYSRKRTGFSGQDQRKLALAVKNARFLGLLPFVGRV
ncbi:MAG: 30S ribosomal protein S18 [Planctomycetes bacterium]|nr:30S ribosomal protein S18 [Planctomycetota bacterium]